MKANQNFRNADDAVSPVIGVILMVAITVVLAAVVFVLVSDLGDTGDSAPSLSFTHDVTDHTLTVVKADPSVAWADIGLSCSAGAVVDVDGAAKTGDVTAGQVLTCNAITGDGTPLAGTLTVTHTPTNTLIKSQAI